MPPHRRPHPHTRPPRHAGESGASAHAWLYGRHAVAAALANPARRWRRLAALPETAAEAQALLKRAARAPADAALEVMERRALDALLPAGAVHQGFALAADPLPAPSLEEVTADLPEGPHILVVLDQVTDPHNVGAILRSAAAFGARAVIVPEHGAPPVTGTLAKTASGALELVPLVRVANLARALERLKERGFWSVGLEAEAPDTLAGLDLPQHLALVLGAEGGGLRRLTREHCDFLARLPTRGPLASLNVSNAAAVALYELAGRRAGAV
jgi:23S rRNA (guanosine2251-2'-O)-methyltransferase